MKFATILTCLLMVLAGAVQGDPIDPDPNGIGIFFDEGAGDGSWCATADVGTQVTAYLCLTRTTDQSGFTAWEGRIEASAPNALAGFTMRGDATNASTAPEFVVAFGTPLPYQLSTVVLEITVDVVWEWAIGLRVWPAASPRGTANLPAYETSGNPGVFQVLQYSLGWNSGTEVPNWAASINDDNCLDAPSVPTENQTWGTVKALYRD